MVKFARPSEAEMRLLLEAEKWDLAKAQPAIDRVLKHRIVLAQGVKDTAHGTRRALNLCNWEPVKAATLLSLQLQLGAGEQQLEQLHEALSLAGDEVDHA